METFGGSIEKFFGIKKKLVCSRNFGVIIEKQKKEKSGKHYRNFEIISGMFQKIVKIRDIKKKKN